MNALTLFGTALVALFALGLVVVVAAYALPLVVVCAREVWGWVR